MERKPLIGLGALWKAKEGSQALLTGRLQDGRKILVLPNKFKNKATQPDYRLMVEAGDVPIAEPEPARQDPPEDDRGHGEDF